jgi:hypothetical protein
LLDTVALDVAVALDQWLKVKIEIYGNNLETWKVEDRLS